MLSKLAMSIINPFRISYIYFNVIPKSYLSFIVLSEGRKQLSVK